MAMRGTDSLHPHDRDRWPPLLLELRRALRPDRARVAAYLSLGNRVGDWTDYAEFLAVHRAWLTSLDRVLAGAGLPQRGPLPDGARADPHGSTPELASPRSSAEALGYLYVLEAFRLGCAVLARRFRGMEPVPEAASPDDRNPWQELVEHLERVSPEEQPAVIQGAREAFSAWERQLATSLVHLGLGPQSAGAHAA